MLRGATVVIALILPCAAMAQEASPLSAIDWLSQSVQTAPAPSPASKRPKKIVEPPISDSATAPSVTVTSLDGPSPDPIGLLPSDVTGLPRDLWARSDSKVLVDLMRGTDANALPALQSLMMTLLLAEADPPRGAGADGALFLARVDKLLDLGALDPALALLDLVDPTAPDLFRRWFDVSLLTGAEDDACDVMLSTPSVAPTFPARIFCLARSGDWAAAALTLNTHRVLGDITPQEEALLSRFLDPELYEDEPPLTKLARVSPLVFRMFEANGEALPTRGLPNAFAHADLRDTTGWKAQLEAAERLAKIGAISDSVLHGVYMARTPAASGGVWDRAKAVQKLDAAVLAGDQAQIAAHLHAAWTAMRSIKLEVPFATFYAPALADQASDLALTIRLLSSDYEDAATAAAPTFLTTLAQGAPIAPTSPVQSAIHAAFTTADTSPELEALARNGNLGEAILTSVISFQAGMQGDMTALTDALALWRLVGLEDVARKAALQLIILDRPT